MSIQGEPRRTWRCVLAERLGVVTDDGWEEGDPGPVSPFRVLARRHVERCAYCRSERREWASIRVGFRTLQRPASPDYLLDAVMARIADERERSRDAAQKITPATVRRAVYRAGRGGTSVWLRADDGVVAAIGLAAAALGMAGSVVVTDPAVSAVPRVWPALAAGVRTAVLDAFHAVNTAALQVGAGGALLVGLVWGLTGVVIAAAVSAASESAMSR